MKSKSENYLAYSDEVLIDMWIKGDKYAAGELYDRYCPTAILYCLSTYFKGSREKSEDFVHTTFERIIVMLQKKQESNIQDFSSYFYGSLDKNFKEYYRNLKNRESIIRLLPKASPSFNNHQIFEASDYFKVLLQKLTIAQKECFLLNEEGFNIGEIAIQTKKSKGQVRGLLYRARKTLRTLKQESINRKNLE